MQSGRLLHLRGLSLSHFCGTETRQSSASAPPSLHSRLLRSSRLMRAVVGPWLLLSLAACSGESRQITGPGDDGGGSSVLAALTVHVSLDPADAELATALGWSEGVPGVEVHVNRNGTATWELKTTDADGTVIFEDLLKSPLYRVYAGQRLSAADAEAVSMPVRAFADGRMLPVTGPTDLELDLLADRPGDLVISEINWASPPPWETNGSYYGGMYFEIYNNSDQVQYLDGLVFGFAFFLLKDYDHTSCAFSATVRTDGGGLYTGHSLQFPGTGTEYSIQPGEAKLVAHSAIDHTPVHPQLLDLRHADFEVGLPQLADNPAVPDMRHVGLRPWPDQGLLALPLYYLSKPFDPRAMPIEFRDSQGRGYVRVLRDQLYDTAAFETLWPDSDLEAPTCIPMVHRNFDRLQGGLYEIGFGVKEPLGSLQRLAARTENGRVVLQNTNTSAFDFALLTQTPGWVPDP